MATYQATGQLISTALNSRPNNEERRPSLKKQLYKDKKMKFAAKFAALLALAALVSLAVETFAQATCTREKKLVYFNESEVLTPTFYDVGMCVAGGDPWPSDYECVNGDTLSSIQVLKKTPIGAVVDTIPQLVVLNCRLERRST